MGFRLPGWTREPILWIGGVLTAANAVYAAISGDFVELSTLLESLALLGAAVVGRSRVSPV